MGQSVRLALLVVAVLLAAACARTIGTSSADDGGAASSIPTHVALDVDNHNWSDVVISVEHDGKRDRLGTVKAASKQTLRIPTMWIGASRAIRLIAHRIGSVGEFRSDGFSVQNDQTIEWTLESDLQRSSVALHE
ncbi:MAG TPA: hypothetical protein VGG78_02900 [Gemmatimonadaceae bacterium]|jgi:hypothetical protein